MNNIDSTISASNAKSRLSPVIDGVSLDATGNRSSRGMGTIQAIGRNDFAVDLEVAVNTNNGIPVFATHATLTSVSPVSSFNYSPGCLYRFRLTTRNYSGTIIVRATG